MEEMGIPDHMVQVIRSLYVNKEAICRWHHPINRKERRTSTAGNKCKGEECPGRTLLKPEKDQGHVY